MLLTGSFRRSVDSKQRVAVPKRLRDQPRRNASSASQPANTEASAADTPGKESSDDGSREVYYIAPGTDSSLTLYTEEGFARLARKLEAGSPTGQDVRDFSRLFYSQAHRVELDSQGRFRIPEELFQLARLEQEVMLVGVGDHMEVWNIKAWEDYLAERQTRYDEIAERAFTPKP